MSKPKPKPKPVKNRAEADLRKLLEALGWAETPRQKRAVGEWMRWKGFPKPCGDAWPAKVQAWFDRNAVKIAQYWHRLDLAAGKKVLGKDVAALSAAAPGSEPRNSLGLADTQTALSAMLTRHYGNRINILINAPTIQDWRHGRRLPSGDPPIPLPPPPDGNYWSGPKWVAWFDRWMLPHYTTGTPEGQSELLPVQKLQQMEVRDKLAQLEHNALLREIDQGKWLKREDVARAVDALGAHLNSDIQTQYERLLEARLLETVAALGLPEAQAAVVREAIRTQGRAGTDALKQRLSANLAGLESRGRSEPPDQNEKGQR
jgi:hypothetical protein